MKKVIVTGATGFLGYHLIQELRKQNIQVYAICRKGSINNNRIVGFSNVVPVYCDLEHIEELPNIIGERQFDAFYHLGWKGASGKERANCSIQNENIIWSLKAAEVAKKIGAKKIIVAGTVCERQCDTIVNQKIVCNSMYYLLAKKHTYEMMSLLCKKIGLSLVWCMFYHPVGKYNKHEQLIINTIIKLKNNEDVKFGPATKLFDVVMVEDLAHGFYLAGECDLHEDCYFIGSGQPRLLKEYLIEIRDIIAPGKELNIGAYPDDGLPMDREWLDIKPFSEETGYCPRGSFREYVENANNVNGGDL